MAKTNQVFKYIGNKLAAVYNWAHNTRVLRAQMMLSRKGVRFDKHGNVIGGRTYVD